MDNKRYFEIDALRGLAILAMILIHTNAYFLNNKIADWLWDFNEWAVPVFIFCSAYIYFKKPPPLKNLGDFFSYIKKRFLRLLRPYYLFALIYLLISLTKDRTNLAPSFIIPTLTINGGTLDINWLVLLFLVFAFLMPIIYYLAAKKKVWFYGFFSLSLLSSIVFIFYKFPANYRLIMWLPWSLIIFFSWLLVKNENSNRFLIGGAAVSLIMLFIVRQIKIALHQSLIQYQNKYPPNFYHLIYGVSFIFILFFLAKKGLFNFQPGKMLLTFLSRYSFPIYFIHYLIIYILTVIWQWRFNGWVDFFLWVFVSSLITQVVVNASQRYIMARRFEYWPVRAS